MQTSLTRTTPTTAHIFQSRQSEASMSNSGVYRSNTIQEVISLDSSSCSSGSRSTENLTAIRLRRRQVIVVDDSTSSEGDDSVIEISDDESMDSGLNGTPPIGRSRKSKSQSDMGSESFYIENIATSLKQMSIKNESQENSYESSASESSESFGDFKQRSKCRFEVRERNILDSDSDSDDDVSSFNEPRPSSSTCQELNDHSDTSSKSGESATLWVHDETNKIYRLPLVENTTKYPKIQIPFSVFDALFEHQKAGVAWMAGLHPQRIGGGLMDDMGMGKSRTLLTFIGGLMRASTIRNTLIIAPLSVLRSWEAEAHKVLKLCVPRVSIIVVSSETSKNSRYYHLQRALQCSHKNPHIVISTYGLVSSGPSDFIDETSFFDYVALDEAHVIKNPSTRTHKNCKLICSSRNTRRLILTGTPIMNHLNELWALMDFATSGRILGKLPDFVKYFTKPIEAARDKNATNYVMREGEKANLELKEKLSPYILQRLKIDFLADKLPTKSDFVVWTHISEKQRSMYEKYVASGESAVAAVLAGEITSPLEAITWLKKLCGHPILVDKERQGAIGMLDNCGADELIQQSTKLHVLVSLITKLRHEGHRMLVFSQSTRMLDIIERVLCKIKMFRVDGQTKEKDRQRFVDNFNRDDSKAQVMLLSTKAAGVGLTLVGADRVIIYDPSWNPAEDSQAIDRCYRIGQTKEVVVFRLIAAGTVEEKMYEKQVHKDGIRRVVMTSAGNSTKRYFDRNELRRLFSLSEEGKCDVLDRLGQADQCDRVSVESLEHGTLASMHKSIVGISKHDALYAANSVVSLLDDSPRTSSTFEESSGRSAWSSTSTRQTNNAIADNNFPRPTVMGRSQRALLKKRGEVDKENSIFKLGNDSKDRSRKCDHSNAAWA